MVYVTVVGFPYDHVDCNIKYTYFIIIHRNTNPAFDPRSVPMNECLTTPQHEKQIGYWVSDKW